MSFTITGKEKIVIYGAGERGNRFAEFFYKNGFQVEAILDKRADEISEFKVGNAMIQVVHPGQYVANVDDEIVIISLWNGLFHDEVAELLFERGFKNIIYLPMQKIRNRKSASEMRTIFNAIIEGQCYFESIPEYMEIITSSGFNRENGNYIIHMPIENLFSEEEYILPIEELKGIELTKRKEIMKYAGENLVNYRVYLQLFQYLDKAEGECDDYIDTQVSKCDEKMDERKRILSDRYKLFQIYEEQFALDRNFFIDSASEVVWNKKGYFNIRDGHHRAIYLFYKGVWDIPVRVRESDVGFSKLWKQVPDTFWCESPYLINKGNSLFGRKLNLLICRAIAKKDIVGKKIYINLNDAGLLGRYCYRLGCKLCIDVESKEKAEFAQMIHDLFQFGECLNICTELKCKCEMDFAIMDERYLMLCERIMAQIYILKMKKEGTFYRNLKHNKIHYEELGKCFDGENEFIIVKLNKEEMFLLYGGI